MRVNELLETVGEAGLEYELSVYNTIASAKVNGLIAGDAPGAGYSNVGAGDIQASYNNQPFNIEVKLNAKAQMGGGSVRYNRQTGELIPSEKLSASSDPGDLAIILAAVKSKIPAMDNYLDQLATIAPISIHSTYAANGIPFVASKDAREKLKTSKFQKQLNDIIHIDAKHISNMYNKKGVYYIQIGGAGLFYMGQNPLNLPIPPFQGEAQIEIRLGYAGDTNGTVTLAFNKKIGNTGNSIEARTGTMRAIGRLKSSSSSDYSLDDVGSIQKLFKTLFTPKPKMKTPPPKQQVNPQPANTNPANTQDVEPVDDVRVSGE